VKTGEVGDKQLFPENLLPQKWIFQIFRCFNRMLGQECTVKGTLIKKQHFL